MPRSDGTVIIDTKIDMDGLNKGTVDIQNQFDRMSQSTKLTADAINSAFSRPVENARIKVESLERQLDGVQAKFSESISEGDDKAAERYGAQRERVYERLETARRKLEMETRAAAQKEAEAEERAAQRTEEANRKAAAAAQNVSRKAESSANSMSTMEKSARRFKNRLREIVTGALFFNVISTALRRLTQTMWGSISSTDQMKAALSNLKGAAYTAASPLLSVLSNAFSTLANAIATALSYLTQLYSLLSGKSLGALSKTAEEMNNVASSAGAAGGAADKAKKSFAGFDEITTLAPKDSGGGGGGVSTPNYDYNLDSGINPQIQALANKIQELIEPLKEIDFSKSIKSLNNFGSAFASFGKTVGKALESVWKNILVPMAKWSIEKAAPASVDLLSDAIKALTKMLDPLIDGFEILMDAMEPVFEFIGDVFIMSLESLGDMMEKIGDTFEEEGDTIRNIFQNIGEAINLFWTLAQPILEQVKKQFEVVFDFIGDHVETTIEYIIGILDGMITFIVGVFTGDMEKAWSGVQKVLDTASEAIGTTIFDLTDLIGSLFNNAVDFLIKAWESVPNWFKKNVVEPIKNAFSTIWDTITGVFNGDVQLSDVVDKVGGYFKTLANGIIKSINSALMRANSYLNQMIGKLKGFSVFGVYPFSNLTYSVAPQIPYLAKGAVIPPNAPFMAMLGDQRHGTNIEAPLSTIQEAVAIVMEDMIQSNIAGHEATIAVLREILEAILGIEIGDSVIGEAVERYNQITKRARGTV